MIREKSIHRKKAGSKREAAGSGAKGKRRARDRKSIAQPEITVRRAYTLSLRGESDDVGRLWKTHRALNAGTEVFADWLMTLGGGQPHTGAREEQRLMIALSWLTIEAGAESTLPTVDDTYTLIRLEEILRGRGAEEIEIDEWSQVARAALSASHRDDSVWVDRAKAFDSLARSLGLADVELAREDASIIFRHLFGEDVFVLKAEKAEAGARDADSSGAGNLTYHLFSYLFGDAPSGFGTARHQLHYGREWAKYLAGRLAAATDLDPFQESASGRRAGDERSPNSWLRQMFAQAAERVAGHRTKLRRQEAERVSLNEGEDALSALLEREETREIVTLIEEYRERRSQETGALRPYIISRRALVGWRDVAAAWTTCRNADERRAALTSLQRSARKGKWGDAALFLELADDKYIEAWQDPATAHARPNLLFDYAAAWEARRDRQRLLVASYRHVDPYLHPVFGRFGVSNPQIVFNPGSLEEPPTVSLVLCDGSRAFKTPFTAASCRLQTELIEREGEARRSRRTKLAAWAARAAVAEKNGMEPRESDNALSLLKGVFETEAAGKILVKREDLKRAHEREHNLRWTLSLTLDLRPMGPWMVFVERAAPFIEPLVDRKSGQMRPATFRPAQSRWAGLSYPFRRSDMQVGRGGELHNLPGVRVLGVDLRQRFGAACALWESVGGEEFDRRCEEARTEGRSVIVTPLWAIIEGAGLFRRTGGDEERAPWARLIRQVIVTLPGEEQEPRPLLEKEEAAFNDLASMLGVAPPPVAEGFTAAGLAILRRFELALSEHVREGLRLARGGGADAKGSLEDWEERDRTLQKVLRRIERLLTGKDLTSRSRERGGLSLRRIEMLEELYSRQKSFKTRPTPHEPKGTTIPEDFARRLRRKIAALKKLRVRTLAARIVGCALGEGKEGEATFPYAHAIVIEDLRQYRTAGTQTRAENRGLMAWAAGSLREALATSCQLHGLHMREVPAAYTSRRSVKTGAPAIRCFEMSAADLLESGYWRREVERARERLSDRRERPADALLVAYADRGERGTLSLESTVLVPAEAGILLVSLDEQGRLRKTHVGQDAAANIGLEALMSPNFPASVWKIPAVWKAKEKVYVPAPTIKKENPVLSGWSAHAATDDPPVKGRVVNLWRAPAIDALTQGVWLTTGLYWQRHEAEICRAIEARLEAQGNGKQTAREG